MKHPWIKLIKQAAPSRSAQQLHRLLWKWYLLRRLSLLRDMTAAWNREGLLTSLYFSYLVQGKNFAQRTRSPGILKRPMEQLC